MKPSPENIYDAAQRLKREELVVFPTETVYGLGGIASSDAAVKAIYAAKGRPAYNPLIVHVQSQEEAAALGAFPEEIKQATEAFWPGPLTVVVPLKNGAPLSPLATAGLKTVALRFSKNPVLLELLRQTGGPLVAPSANRSGSLTATSAAHAQKYFPNLMVLDGGETEIGLESTVITHQKGLLHILRPGAISKEALEEKVDIPVVFSSKEKKVTSPGQTDRHYAPSIRMRMDAREPLKGEAFLGFGKHAPEHTTLNLSPSGALEEAAKNLFSFLHTLDNPHRYSGIAVAPIPNTGLGASINDRLRRACQSSPS